jgi:glutathione S-transferase
MATRLVTIPVSHFCEKARWALDLAGVPYVEDGWAPVAHRLALRRLRATTAPALVTDDGTVLRESTDIVRHADGAGGLGLFGDDRAERSEVEALVARFDATVGPAARLLTYATLLGEPEAFVRTAGAGLSPRRAIPLRVARPLIAATIRRFFGVDADAVRRAEATLEAELAFAGATRGTSRYLVGGRFTAADLTFAALLAPAVQPAGYGAPVPPLEEMPAARRADVARWRATPSATVVSELYAQHRHARMS